MDVRSAQQPLKEKYRSDPNSSRITLKAGSTQSGTPLACSVDIGRALYRAEAHRGVGGTGTASCSGDLLLGALAACAQLTCQLVAAAMEIPVENIRVDAEGDLDLRGTLGVSKEVPVGFQQIRVLFHITAPNATEEQLRILQKKAEQYCVVLQTLNKPPLVETKWLDSNR